MKTCAVSVITSAAALFIVVRLVAAVYQALVPVLQLLAK